MTETNLRDLPDHIAEIGRDLTASGKDVIGWRAVTDPTFTECHEGCMAPGSSPHGHSTVIGYDIVMRDGILRVDVEGMGVRDSSLHSFPEVWHINVYESDQEYGGPEEGGWWYPTGRFVASESRVLTVTEDEAHEAARELDRSLREEADDNNVDPIHSVMYRGGRFVVRAEREPGQDFPAERPFYS